MIDTASRPSRLSALLPVDRDATERWIGGASMILGPALVLTGVLLRFPFDFFFPAQLTAYTEHPALMTAAYSCFALGNILLVPAVLVLARRVHARAPAWAVWGGALTVLGLLARTFHAGADHLAFQLAAAEGAGRAADIVGETYGAFHVFRTFSVAILLGWIVLAIGARRARVLGWAGAVALALATAFPLGVLKGSTAFSLVAALGLVVALVPFGARILTAGPAPRPGTALRWISVLSLVVIAATLLGQAG